MLLRCARAVRLPGADARQVDHCCFLELLLQPWFAAVISIARVDRALLDNDSELHCTDASSMRKEHTVQMQKRREANKRLGES